MNVSSKVQSFILHFGEMGSRWGINRTVGQMYALIMMTEKPLNADDISEALSISRSNVSMGLKELQSWRLIKPHHIAGDRKEYYEAPDDCWEIARTLIEERRKREIEPTLSLLRDELMNEPVTDEGQYAQARMRELHDMIEMMTHWSLELQRLNSDSLAKLMKLGSGVSKVLDFKDKITGKTSADKDSD